MECNFEHGDIVVLPDGYAGVFGKVIDAGACEVEIAFLDPADNNRTFERVHQDILVSLPAGLDLPEYNEEYGLVEGARSFTRMEIDASRVRIQNAADSDGEYQVECLDGDDENEYFYVRLQMFEDYERWVREVRGFTSASADQPEQTSVDTFALLGQIPNGG